MFQPPGRLLKTGVNTLQKTLILKKQAELEEVDKELCRQRQEFKSRMEILTRRKAELKAEQQQVSVESFTFRGDLQSPVNNFVSTT